MIDTEVRDSEQALEKSPSTEDIKDYLNESIRASFLQFAISLHDADVKQLSQYVFNGIANLQDDAAEDRDLLRDLNMDDFMIMRASKHSKFGSAINGLTERLFNKDTASEHAVEATNGIVNAIGLASCISIPTIVDTFPMKGDVRPLPLSTLQWIATCLLQNGIKVAALQPIEGLDRYVYLKAYQNTLKPETIDEFKPFRPAELYRWARHIDEDYCIYAPSNSWSNNDDFSKIQGATTEDIQKMLDSSIEKLAKERHLKSGEWFYNTDEYTVQALVMGLN